MNHPLGDFVLLESRSPHVAQFLLCLVKSSLMVGLTWAAVRLLRRRSALARNWAWRCALVGLLGLTFWEFGPAALTNLRPAWRLSPPLEESDAPIASGDQALPTEPTAATSPPLDSRQNVLAVLNFLESSLPILWWTGAALYTFWSMCRMAAGFWWLKTSAIPPNAFLLGIASGTATRLGLARSPAIALRHGLTTPLLIGWTKPLVFLPAESPRWTAKKVEAVFLHELTHWQRKDGWWQTSANLITCIWWWNPLVWLARRGLRMEAEQTADDRVVLTQSGATDYAQTLIDIAASAQPQALPLGIAMVGPSSLEARVQAILQEDPWRGKMGNLGFGLTLSLTCLLLGLGGFYLSATPSGPSRAIVPTIEVNSRDANDYLKRGRISLLQGDYAHAISSLDQALQIDPKSAPAYFSRGRAYKLTGKNQRALADYTQAIQFSPGLVAAYVNRGQIYNLTAQYDRAIADFDRAIQLDPQRPIPYLDRGVAYGAQGHHDKALADFRSALQLDPNFAAAYNNLALVLATCPQAAFRDGKQAVADATEACELSQWNNANQIGTLAAAYAEAGDFGDAIKWENQVLATPNLAPEDSAMAKARLALYQAKTPYHRESALSSAEASH